MFLSLHLSVLEFLGHVGCAVVPDVDAVTEATGVPWMQGQS